MSKPKQTTLFQSWGANTQKKRKTPAGPQSNNSNRDIGGIIDLCDEDDEDLMLALQESLKDAGELNTNTASDPRLSKVKEASSSLFSGVGNNQHAADANSVDGFSEDSNDIYENIALSDINIPETTNIEILPGFDINAGRLWIYPTNYPVRDYQFSIVKAGLFNNTMVVLPTGLGKTFIAAVVMYNMYKWYPQGKIIFMAPTKPLVAQQIEACYNIMGIPQEDTAEMTGAMNPTERKRAWNLKRVFFLTPQVLTNDLSRTACPAESVKCLVVDEAHKATGNHAYCQVVRELVKYNEAFRILALSATPGSDIKAVQQVINNLLVSHIELRSEDSPDIKKFSHERKVDKVVVPLGQELSGVKEKYLQVMTMVVMRLRRMGVLYNREAKSLSKFLILKAREAFRQDPPQNLQRNQYGAVEGDFALCMSLYHGYDLLQQHGLRSLFNYLEGILTGEKGYGRTKTELLKSADFRDLMENLRGKIKLIKAADPSIRPSQMSPVRASQLEKPLEIGHPKMEKLRDIVVEHFEKYKNDGLETRIMIFSQFRDSVNEITEILHRHRPLVKVMSFIGQSSAGKSSKGFSQKDQLKVMKQFRDGGYNTLVSTCVGEEGLDIGDVDLIVCFDAHKSPIRLVQRMGRTGRKREGRIVMLVTEGKEEQIYNQSQYSKRSIHKAIQNGTKSLHFYPRNPSMVPNGLHPSCHKMHITVQNKYDAQVAKGKVSKTKNNNLTNMFPGTKTSTRSKARVADKKDGNLTPEELQYWNDHFKVDEKAIPLLQETCMQSLGEKEIRLANTDDKHQRIDLGAWMPWQNRLQDYKMVDHSSKSRHLVELVEFMDIQSSVGGEEDNYGLEMQIYLNEEDIIKPGQSCKTRQGILKYCTPNADQHRQERKEMKDKKTTNQKKRRSEALPEFDLEEEKNSDSELPVLDDIIKGNDEKNGETLHSKKKKKNKKSMEKTTEECPSVSKIQIIEDEDSDDFITADNANESNSDIENFDIIQPLPDLPHLEEELSNQSSEGVEKEKLSPKENHSKVSESANIMDTDNEYIDKNIIASGVVNREIDHIDLQQIKCDVTDKQKELLELLPTLPPFDLSGKFYSKDDSSVNDSVLICLVKTPPRLEEVSQLIKDLDERDAPLSPVDILDLIDEWEKEKSTNTEEKSCKIEKSTNTSSEEKSCKIETILPEKSTSNMASQTKLKSNTTKASVTIPLQIKPSCSKERRSYMKKMLDVENNSSPLKSQLIKKSLFKKSDRTLSFGNCKAEVESCIDDGVELLDKQLPAKCEMTIGKSSLNIPCLELKDFDSSFSQESNMNMPFKTYESTQSHDKSESCLKENHKTKSEFIKASVLVCDNKQNETKNEQPRILSSLLSDKNTTSTPLASKIQAKTAVHNLEDSFFNDNNPLFDHFQTPNISCNVTDLEIDNDKTEEPRKKSNTSLSKSVNTTQITFTQALAFVHESFNVSNNQSVIEEERKGIGTLPLPSSEINESSNGRHKPLQNTDVTLENNHNTPALDLPSYAKEKGKDVHSQITIEIINTNKKDCDQDVVPDFDLGFDFDDELDEVIPPSPPDSTQPFSQVSMASITAATLVSDLQTTFVPSPSLIGGLGQKFSQQKQTETSLVAGSVTMGESSVNSVSMHPEKNKSDKGESKNTKCSETTEVINLDYIEDDEIFSEIIQDPLNFQPPPVSEQTKHDISDQSDITSPSVLNNRDSKYVNRNKFDLSKEDKTKLCFDSQHPNKPLSRTKQGYNSCSTPIARVSPQIVNTSNIVSQGNKQNHNGIANIETDVIGAADFDESMHTQTPGNSAKVAHKEHKISPLTKRTESAAIHVHNMSYKYNRELCNDAPEINHSVNMESEIDINKSVNIKLDESMHPNVGILDSPNEEETAISDLDESVVQVKFKKKSKVIAISPDTPSEANQTVNRNFDDSEFKTPLKPPSKKSHKRKLISSDSETAEDESPLLCKKKRRVVVQLDTTFKDDNLNDEDDFEDLSHFSNKPSKSKESKATSKKESKHKRKPKGCGFIEEEADVSDDGSDLSSGADEEEDADFYDASFVNDATQLTQDVADSDMRAVYLQSVKSPMSSGNMFPGRFKLQYNYDNNMDVYSQMPRAEDEGDSCYMEDSFCVGSNSEMDESEFMDEQTIMEAAIINKGKRSRTTRNSNKNLLNNGAKGKSKLTKDGTRKRIKRLQDTSSSEEEFERNDTVLEHKLKGHRKLSSSESDVIVSPLLLQNKKTEISVSDNERDYIKENSPYSGSTQILSLQSRCQQRLGNNEPDTNNKPFTKSRCDKNRVPKSIKQQVCDDSQKVSILVENSHSKTSKLSIKKSAINDTTNIQKNLTICDHDIDDRADFDLSFDLGLDNFDDGDTENKYSVNSSAFAGHTSGGSDNSHKNSLFNDESLKQNRSKSDKNKSNLNDVNKKISSSVLQENHNSSLFNSTINELHTNKNCGQKVNSSFVSKSSLKQEPLVTKSNETSPIQAVSKEERLRLSKLKQEEFKRKHAEKLQKRLSATGHAESNNEVTILDHTVVSDTNDIYGMYASPMPNNSLMTSILQPISPKGQKLTVFVDSREINGAQDVISNLRAKHGFTAMVTQLQGCDYILSNRMAVERKCLSDFTNGANKNKLVDRIKQMTELFERGVLVVEKDRIKVGEKDPQRPLLKSRYVETMLASLCQMQVKVYFSESQENTADVLAQLIDTEKRKGFTVECSINLSETQQQLMKFFLSLPKVSFVTALNFTQSYRTLRDFIKSPIGVIENKGHINRQKAQEIHNYMKHRYSPQMIGIKK